MIPTDSEKFRWYVFPTGDDDTIELELLIPDGEEIFSILLLIIHDAPKMTMIAIPIPIPMDIIFLNDFFVPYKYKSNNF